MHVVCALRVVVILLLLACNSIYAEAEDVGSIRHTLEVGDRLRDENKEDAALEQYRKVYSSYRDNMDESSRRTVVLAYLNAGKIYHQRGEYNRALESFIYGLKLCDSMPMTDLRMVIYKHLGNIYWIFGDYERAINLYERGYALRDKAPDKKVECDLLVNLTGAYCFVGNPGKAREYHKLAKRLINPNDSVKVFMSIYNDGLILETEKRHKEAVDKFYKAAKLAPSKSYLAHVAEMTYVAYMNLNVPDSVIHYLYMCSNLSRENGKIDMYVQTLNDLADFYSKRDPSKSSYYKSKYTEMSDSIMKSGSNIREFYRLRNIQYLYELEMTDRRISELALAQEIKDKEIRMQRIVLTVLVIALVVFLVFLWIVLHQKRQIRIAYKNLFEINRNTIQEYKLTQQQCAEYEKRIEELDVSSESMPAGSPSSLDDEKKVMIWQKIEQKMEHDKIYCDTGFSLSRLAEAVESNQAYVSRVVNEKYGKSFTDFVNDYRIREACVRLLDTEKYGHYTISAIAEDVGYKAQSTFIRAFRKNTGLPPSVYQKMALPKKDGSL
ncbi:MAG: helix-turn-helix domain-containing protein [Lepagella sp.]